MEENPLQEVLGEYSIGDVRDISKISGGLINHTYRISADTGDYILQSLGEIFTETTVEDMQKVTLHLKAKGVVTPQLIPTKSGAIYHKDESGRVWRIMTMLDGVVYGYGELPDDSYTAEAGKVLAEFHFAMEDFDAGQLKSKPILHQTQKFYDDFSAVYDKIMADESDERQREVYEYIQKTMPSLMLPANLPTTIIHGDPKISNIMFKDGKGLCMIDLDTCMKHTPLVELGDALRWCAISEEAFPNTFSISRFKDTLEGYSRVKKLDSAFLGYIPQAFAMVTLGLASRFAKDVHYDNYFGWDPEQYSSRKEHNKARAKSLVSLTQDIIHRTDEMKEAMKGL